MLLLSLCKNLGALQIACKDPFVQCSWLTNFITELQNETNSASCIAGPNKVDFVQFHKKLRQFRYHGLAGENYASIWDFERCFESPLMTKVVMECAHLMRAEEGLVTQFFHLTKLHLINSTWEAAGVADLLIHAPHLQVLELKLTPDGWHKLKGYNLYLALLDINFAGLGEVLRRHGTSLVELTIDPRGDPTYNTDNARYVALLGALKSLVRLRSLSVPLVQLFDLSDADYYFSRQARSDTYSRGMLSTRLRDEILSASIEHVHLLDHQSSQSRSIVNLQYPGAM